MSERGPDDLLDRLNLTRGAARTDKGDRGGPVGQGGHDQVGKAGADLDQERDSRGDGCDHIGRGGRVERGDELLEQLVGFFLERA